MKPTKKSIIMRLSSGIFPINICISREIDDKSYGVNIHYDTIKMTQRLNDNSSFTSLYRAYNEYDLTDSSVSDIGYTYGGFGWIDNYGDDQDIVTIKEFIDIYLRKMNIKEASYYGKGYNINESIKDLCRFKELRFGNKNICI